MPLHPQAPHTQHILRGCEIAPFQKFDLRCVCGETDCLPLGDCGEVGACFEFALSELRAGEDCGTAPMVARGLRGEWDPPEVPLLPRRSIDTVVVGKGGNNCYEPYEGPCAKGGAMVARGQRRSVGNAVVRHCGGRRTTCVESQSSVAIATERVSRGPCGEEERT